MYFEFYQYVALYGAIVSEIAHWSDYLSIDSTYKTAENSFYLFVNSLFVEPIRCLLLMSILDK